MYTSPVSSSQTNRPDPRTWLIALGCALSPTAFALNTGTDLNLSLKPIAGGMAGAAYVRPQEVSAALFGNPATLTQFKGFNVGLGAALLEPEVDNFQSKNGFTNHSYSLARNYVVPDAALGGEVLPGFVLGAGIAVDSGLGADYRTHPINAGAGLGLGGNGAGGAATLPLLVELISFSANVGAAYEVTPDLSVGAALTVGVGFAQFGTSGTTSGLASLTGDFGGTTSSVHNISLRGSVGATYRLTPNVTIGASFKSPLRYNYHNVLATTVGGSQDYQSVRVEQPLEVAWGIAANITPQLLVEADALWKNWSNSSLYQDVWQDQFLALFGGQYTVGDWQFRAGYSYATPILRDEPHGTVGGFKGVGTVPLDTAVPGVLDRNDVIKVVQTTLGPVIWQHTLTAGVGYAFTPKFRVDAFAAYAFEESASRDTLALGHYRAEAAEWALGLGANFKF
ncbi:OmpP1/FadL family transporter [Methylocaldum szegediense]|jgi:long-chain fatty acid transport protein|uniref:Long-chain fatty acid transport protein n=1 Tax=Methylocaldum szegediense TaxID=73780 RepID=A0ABN8XAJ0_9GAMM|nr:outer membrane protein transport protein [Methylocaldum szegediense]CAI8975480.1 long-chain fatty acid transport protein [Methylocaldum szegediense]